MVVLGSIPVFKRFFPFSREYSLKTPVLAPSFFPSLSDNFPLPIQTATSSARFCEKRRVPPPRGAAEDFFFPFGLGPVLFVPPFFELSPYDAVSLL